MIAVTNIPKGGMWLCSFLNAFVIIGQAFDLDTLEICLFDILLTSFTIRSVLLLSYKALWFKFVLKLILPKNSSSHVVHIYNHDVSFVNPWVRRFFCYSIVWDLNVFLSYCTLEHLSEYQIYLLKLYTRLTKFVKIIQFLDRLFILVWLFIALWH